ncbi:MAG: DUF2007 domain-containing protein [Deltaproteobacteria bacterium]|nr:DUF2007 domain-containing protein [Deltaproteobacteria bacterium]
MSDETWKVVHTADGMVKANIVKGRLVAEGIEARLDYEAIGAIYGFTIDGLGAVRVLVPAEELEQAREVLAQRHDDEETDDEDDGEPL